MAYIYWSWSGNCHTNLMMMEKEVLIMIKLDALL